MQRAATLEAYQLLHQGSEELAYIERNGLRIDVGYLDNAIIKTKERVAKLERKLDGDKIAKEWRQLYKEKTNFQSTDQMGKLMFEHLGYEYPSKTLTSGFRWKTDEKTLELLDIPFIKLFVKIKKLKKAVSSFLMGIKRELTGEFVHPSFLLNIARTYRSSCKGPNIQQMPIRSGLLAELIRKAFIPRKGHCFVEIDYSTLEVRIGCCYHKDKKMIEYINDPKMDMHYDAAERIFKCSRSEVTKEMRFFAKNQFTFAQFYGSYYVQCAPPLWLSVDRESLCLKESGQSLREHLTEAGLAKLGACDPKKRAMPGTFEHHIKKIEDWLWGTQFRGYAKWRKEWYNKYLEEGGFISKTGFRCDGLLSRNDVTNYPIQGSAFHCLLWSMIQMNRWLREERMKSKIIAQIHDSILGDVHLSELEDYVEKATQVTTVDLRKHWKWIIVPLTVEMEIGRENWFNKEPLHIQPA